MMEYGNNNDNNRLRPTWDRRYSNLLDLPGVNLQPKTAEKITTPWLNSQDFNMQERRFFKDFRFDEKLS